MVWNWMLILLAVFFSAVFSGSESALFSLSAGQLEMFSRSAAKAGHRIRRLLDDPNRLLGTLLLGNLVVNTAASALFTLAALAFAGRLGRSPVAELGVGGLIMTLALLVFGEVTPKLVAQRNPSGFARFGLPVVVATHWLFKPVVRLLLKLSSALTLVRREPEVLSAEELHTMVAIGRERGIIHETEEGIITRLIELDRRTVSEVMTPRIDIVGIDSRATIREAIGLCRTSGFSRLPVFDTNPDTIIGVVHAKELLVAPDPNAPVRNLARPAYFVPEVKRLPELLDELRRKGSHIAIVIDQFGQTAGLVTLEDLLEAVLGEITDEFDVASELPYSKLDESSYLVDGEIDIVTLNRLFANAFRNVGHDRLSTFIHDRLGRLPREGDIIKVNDIEIAVRAMAGLKLEKVLITRAKRSDPEP